MSINAFYLRRKTLIHPFILFFSFSIVANNYLSFNIPLLKLFKPLYSFSHLPSLPITIYHSKSFVQNYYKPLCSFSHLTSLPITINHSKSFVQNYYRPLCSFSHLISLLIAINHSMSLFQNYYKPYVFHLSLIQL